MGKNTDKLFVTHSEWTSKDSHGPTGGAVAAGNHVRCTTSPFWFCSISQQPITDSQSAVCDEDGFVFEIKQIVPYIMKHGINPVTRKAARTKDLIKLKLKRNKDGAYIDPVSFKEFQPLSSACVIKTSGNVYFEETVDEFNVKARNWTDLVDATRFERKDILLLKGGVGVEGGVSSVQMRQEPGESAKSLVQKKYLAPSVTSTAANLEALADDEDITVRKRLKPKRFLENGYACIETNHGRINVELWPKYSPKAVYNFVRLADKKYYDGLTFHRNLAGFMIQGGDPNGDGTGGHSAFRDGRPFGNETNTPYAHDSRGILSMANKGKNSNTSQFFILYKKSPQLDGKHTVFGRVVGGWTVLDTLERVPSTAAGTPKQPIVMQSVRVLVDPFDDAITDNNDDEHQTSVDKTPWLKSSGSGDAQSQIGVYLSPQPVLAPDTIQEPRATKRPRTTIQKSSFSSW